MCEYLETAESGHLICILWYKFTFSLTLLFVWGEIAGLEWKTSCWIRSDSSSMGKTHHVAWESSCSDWSHREQGAFLKSKPDRHLCQTLRLREPELWGSEFESEVNFICEMRAAETLSGHPPPTLFLQLAYKHLIIDQGKAGHWGV